MTPGLDVAQCHYGGHRAGHGQWTPWWPQGWAWTEDTMVVMLLGMARGHHGGPRDTWSWSMVRGHWWPERVYGGWEWPGDTTVALQ